MPELPEVETVKNSLKELVLNKCKNKNIFVCEGLWAVEKLIEKGFKVTHFFYNSDKFENNKIILITGTNGKTTTTALTSHILSKKFNAPYCGNIGISPIEYKDKNVDYYTPEGCDNYFRYGASCGYVVMKNTIEQIAKEMGVEL